MSFSRASTPSSSSYDYSTGILENFPYLKGREGQRWLGRRLNLRSSMNSVPGFSGMPGLSAAHVLWPRCWDWSPGMNQYREASKETNEYWIEFSPKHRGARSRLYRRRFLQVNTGWKALAEIYTKHSFAPFFKLKISAKNRQHFFAIE